jgi:hypothetical protein
MDYSRLFHYPGSGTASLPLFSDDLLTSTPKLLSVAEKVWTKVCWLSRGSVRKIDQLLLVLGPSLRQ